MCSIFDEKIYQTLVYVIYYLFSWLMSEVLQIVIFNSSFPNK